MAKAVITRDAEGAAPYAAALAPLGLELVAMPVTHTAPPADPDALARALGRGGHHAIVCASARAAAAVVRARSGGPLPDIFAVGPATARVLADAQLAPIVPDGARDGASLARAIVAMRALAGKAVLVPRAEDGRDDLIAILGEAGALVEDVISYRTVAAAADDPAIARGRALLAAGEAAWCIVFAPSQVAALVALAGAALQTRFAAIGATTAEALRAAGFIDIVVAATPTPEGIANAVAAVYPRKP